MLDPFNPRSVAFQIERLGEHIATLPVLSDDGMLETPRRIAIELDADLTTTVAAGSTPNRSSSSKSACSALAEAIAARYFLQGANARAGRKASGLA